MRMSGQNSYECSTTYAERSRCPVHVDGLDSPRRKALGGHAAVLEFSDMLACIRSMIHFTHGTAIEFPRALY